MKKIIYFIKKKLFEPRETVIASNILGPDEIRKILEEAQKRFMELPVGKQMEGFFGKKTKK